MAGKVQTAAGSSGQMRCPVGSGERMEQQMLKKKKKAKRLYDHSLLPCITSLTAFGLVMIYSASSYSTQLSKTYNGNGVYFMQRQAGIAAAGLAATLVISKMDYHTFTRSSVFAYLMLYILMIVVSLVGHEVNGKKRWLGVGLLSFQPTEFVKIVLAVLLAAMITIMGMKVNKWKNMGYVVALTSPMARLVAMNSLSSGTIVREITFVILFVSCKVKWSFFSVGALRLTTPAFAGPMGKFLTTVELLQPYQYRRTEAWLGPEFDPTDKGFQVLQGLYAIGSGGLVGQGLGESIQKLGLLPESQNDMIFAIICEKLRLSGVVSVILIFLFMIYRFMIIVNNAPDLFEALPAVGVMGYIAIQVILNITVMINTIPNTGIILPSISYGGTSVLSPLIEMGIVLSVSNQIKLEK